MDKSKEVNQMFGLTWDKDEWTKKDRSLSDKTWEGGQMAEEGNQRGAYYWIKIQIMDELGDRL